MLLQGPGDALPPAQSGLAADTGIHNIESGMGMLQFLMQYTHPTFFCCDAVSG